MREADDEGADGDLRARRNLLPATGVDAFIAVLRDQLAQRLRDAVAVARYQGRRISEKAETLALSRV